MVLFEKKGLIKDEYDLVFLFSQSHMKFNEYGLMKFAFSSLAISKEGYLQKQGANYQYYKKESSFKQRYFVLKVG